ncbi:MAG: dTDP-4-dehydrorhamnose reductase [Hyphomicrobiaceae bacterium]
MERVQDKVRVLVTGRDGQLGRALVERAASAFPDLLTVAIGRPEFDLADMAGIEMLVARAAPDVVINAAAYTAVDAAETDRQTAFAVNARGAGAVAAAAARVGALVVHVSTDYVFDGSKPGHYVETDSTAPLSVYGESKLAGELAVADAAPRHAIARTSWVHSAVGRNFVKTMLTLAATRDELRVIDDQTGSPTYAPHLADALLAMARALAARPAGDIAFGTYHVTGRGWTTWAGLAREVFAVSARLGGPTARVVAIPTADYPTPARRPQNSRLDCSRLERQCGLALPDWQAGVERCVGRILAAGGP